MNLSAPGIARARCLPVRLPMQTAAVLIAANLIGSPARADEISVSIGAGADRGRTDCVAAYPCDHGDSFGKLGAAYRFDSGLELRGLAFDAGRFQGGDATPLGTPFGGRFKVAGFGFAAGYRWAFARGWSLLGQAGVASVRTRFDYAAPFPGEVGQTTTQPLVGVSLGYEVSGNWRLSLDYDQTRFKVYTTHGPLRLLGASVHYVF
jgi:hypothetical protein